MQRSTQGTSNPVEVSESMKSVMRITRSTSELGRDVAMGAAAITGNLATTIGTFEESKRKRRLDGFYTNEIKV